MNTVLTHDVDQNKEYCSIYSTDKITVQLNLPSDLSGAMNIHQTALPFKVKELMALELFREGIISTGKAAKLLDIPKVAFIDILKRYKIEYFSESPEELANQISMVDTLLKQKMP